SRIRDGGVGRRGGTGAAPGGPRKRGSARGREAEGDLSPRLQPGGEEGSGSLGRARAREGTVVLDLSGGQGRRGHLVGERASSGAPSDLAGALCVGGADGVAVQGTRGLVSGRAGVLSVRGPCGDASVEPLRLPVDRARDAVRLVRI